MAKGLDLCFEIIEKCPNNCMFCSSESNFNKTAIIKYEDFKRTIDYIMKKGEIGELSLSGGEPFLHPDLLKMVSYSKSFGIRTVIFTSGVTNSIGYTEEEKETITEERNRIMQEVEERESDNEFFKSQVLRTYNNIYNPPTFSSIPKELLEKLKEIGLDKIVFDYQAYKSETDHKLMGRKEESRLALLKSIVEAS